MTDDERDRINDVGTAVIRGAIRVHRVLGPGLLESTYQACLAHELERMGLSVKSEVKVPLRYRDLQLDVGYRLDMLIEDIVVVENKVVERILPVHRAQILTYFELTGCRLGYLLNWHVSLMVRGIQRFVLRL